MNSHVDKNKFDHSSFLLKFASIDHITKDIVHCTGECVLFKIDIAHAFHNLRVDAMDSLKFGIKWNESYYADLGVAFSWTHGSVAFQILSDSVAYLVAKLGVKLHCYIDDYTAVVPKAEAEFKFCVICDLLNELSLLLNYDMLTPPTKHLTCLGNDINIDNNTMSISENKLQSIHAECRDVNTRRWLSERAFQTLLGKLLFTSKNV